MSLMSKFKNTLGLVYLLNSCYFELNKISSSSFLGLEYLLDLH
jgi:hypothetical protein